MFQQWWSGGNLLRGKNESLSKQVHIYSVDTSAFYNDKENALHNKILKSYRYRDYLKKLEDNQKNIKNT